MPVELSAPAALLCSLSLALESSLSLVLGVRDFAGFAAPAAPALLPLPVAVPLLAGLPCGRLPAFARFPPFAVAAYVRAFGFRAECGVSGTARFPALFVPAVRAAGFLFSAGLTR